MLDYLVHASTRQRLLVALWRDDRRGNVSELAVLAGTSFAGAYAELEAMHAAGLAQRSRSGGSVVYRARLSHPHARLLKELVGIDDGQDDDGQGDGDDPDDATVRSWLSAMGAPIGAPAVDPPSMEEGLVAGVQLSHRDATVARILPICIHRSRWQMDPARLLVQARRGGEKHAVGFFLELTSVLSGDRTLSRWARPMRDMRVKRTRDFFPGSSTGHARRLAQASTPPLARRWRFRMNMGMDSFEQVFRKHVEKR